MSIYMQRETERDRERQRERQTYRYITWNEYHELIP